MIKRWQPSSPRRRRSRKSPAVAAVVPAATVRPAAAEVSSPTQSQGWIRPVLQALLMEPPPEVAQNPATGQETRAPGAA